jgi:Tfp pilus assembly protein PilE
MKAVRLHYQKGFTLFELILYVAVSSLVLMSLSTFLTFLLSARVKSQVITEVNQQGAYAMYLITETVTNSQSITFPSAGTQLASSSLVTRNATLNPTVFFVSSSTLYMQEASKPKVALTNSRVDVSSLSFDNSTSAGSSEKMMRVSFTITYKNPSGRGEYEYTKSFNGSATIR